MTDAFDLLIEHALREELAEWPARDLARAVAAALAAGHRVEVPEHVSPAPRPRWRKPRPCQWLLGCG